MNMMYYIFINRSESLVWVELQVHYCDTDTKIDAAIMDFSIQTS